MNISTLYNELTNNISIIWNKQFYKYTVNQSVSKPEHDNGILLAYYTFDENTASRFNIYQPEVFHTSVCNL